MYREVEWYATEDERLLGVVILDRIDADYSWIVLSKDKGGAYRSPWLSGVSLLTREAARQALHAAMEGAELRSEADLCAAQEASPVELTAEQFLRLVGVMTDLERQLEQGMPWRFERKES
jgi:hypothetical protein